MQPITFLDVRNAVSRALDAAFPDIPVSGEEIKQDLNPPRFFVRFLEPSHTQELGRRARRDHPLVVHYFPAGKDANEDMYEMADKLTEALQSVTVAGMPASGHGMRFQVVDGVLLFFVTYTFLVQAAAPVIPVMQTLDQTGGIKHG
ncbi:phage tail terminator family protein [Gorillibacterium sp. sgz500922]|uniref:phage tail terminator family protein n=1 Tax=Gorillibacterium sp. sgz500922 TaxID=3446694 RepID=UPI003F670FA9